VTQDHAAEGELRTRMSETSPERQKLVEACRAAEEAYEKLSDQIASVLEAGETVTPDLEAAHSAAMRAAISARRSLDEAEGEG